MADDLEHWLDDELGPRDDAAPDYDGVANPAIAALTRAWTCEKCAPELLPYERELVEEMHALLRSQVAHIARIEQEAKEGFESRDPRGPPALRQMPTVAAAYDLDVARVRYLIAAYLRTRLAKVRTQRINYSDCRDCIAL